MTLRSTFQHLCLLFYAQRSCSHGIVHPARLHFVQEYVTLGRHFIDVFFLKLFQAQAVSKAQLDILHQLSHWNEQRFMILKQRVYTLISSIF